MLAAGGCQTTATPHQRAREEATHQWNVARSRVKAQLARERFDAGDVETAASELAEARRLDPEARELDPLFVRVLLSQGRFAEAERLLAAVRARDERTAAPTGSTQWSGDLPAAGDGDAPRRAELAYLTGLVRQEQGRWNDAVAAYAEARELAPEEEQYRIELARAHLQQGQAQQALVVLSEANRAAGSREYYAALAECWEALGNQPEAALAWQQAAAGAAPSRQCRVRLGTALRRAGRPAEAATVLEELRHAGGSTAAAGDLIELARCYLAAGRANDAMSLARTVLQEDAQSSAAIVVLAYALARQGDSAAALRVTHDGLTREPENRLLLELLAALHWSRQERDPAIAAAQRLGAVEPANDVARAILMRAR